MFLATRFDQLAGSLARFNILASGVTDGAAMRQAMQAETFDVVCARS